MFQSCLYIKGLDRRDLYGNGLVMKHRALHITIVNELVMSKICLDSDMMPFIQINPVRPDIHARDIAGIAGIHDISSGDGNVTEILFTRFMPTSAWSIFQLPERYKRSTRPETIVP